MRYVLEGEWSGYRSSQRKVVHREVIHKPDYYGSLTTIQYTDGTFLSLSVRPAKPREKVAILNGYGDLIWKASRLNKPFVTVLELNSPISDFIAEQTAMERLL